MQFTDIIFVVVYLLMLPLYYYVPQKFRKVFLLLISYAFYCQFGLLNLFALVFFSLLIYLAGLIIEKKSVLYWLFFFIAILGIFVVKNQKMIIEYFLLPSGSVWNHSVVIPIGMSFFVLQGISYIAEVKNGTIVAERNIVDVLLYVCFFPCVISGPIQRGDVFLPKLKAISFNTDYIKSGLIQMTWGYFQKLVISNRLGLFVDTVFNKEEISSGVMLWIGVIIFGIQLYIDFCGYSDIVIGMSKTLGLNLEKNFDFPYMSRSIREFWQKWHISLSTWLKKYIYFPLGGNRKGKMRKWLNLIIVFIVSGFWHGTGIGFLIWGLLHAFYQIFGELTQGIRKKICVILKIQKDDWGYIWFQRLCVFVLVDFSWIFFKCETFNKSKQIINGMLHMDFSYLINGALLNAGLSMYDWVVVIVGLIIFCVGQNFRRKQNIYKVIISGSRYSQLILYSIAVITVICFGVYGSGGESIPFNYFMF